MKIISTLFLLFALSAMLYLNIGQAGSVCLGINEAKEMATESLRTEPLSTITITYTDLQSGTTKYINDHEISYHGSLYDIAYSQTVGDKTTLRVVHDEKEENLISGLKELVEDWITTPKNSRNHSSKQIVLVKDFIPSQKFTFCINSSLHLLCSVYYSVTCNTPFIAVPKSPPKFV